MDSSFLTLVNVSLGLFTTISLIKILVQFGLSNHPARYTSHLIILCVCAYFVGLSLTDFAVIGPVEWMRWRAVPLVAGSLAMLLQLIFMGNQFSRIQQKVVSRLPIIASLLCFAFFPEKAEFFLMATLIVGTLFLSISVGNRYQKRQYFKMVFFLSLIYGCKLINIYWVYVLGEMLLFIALFYFFLFEQGFMMAAKMDEFKTSLEGDAQ